MTLPPAGSQKKGLFSREDYLAPPAIPTGQPPRDVLNTIWRKNEVFLDIGQYSIGSFVMMAWPMFLLFLWGALAFRETLPGFSLGMTIGGLIIVGIPSSFVLYSLTQPVPPPTRFNRQRREVCVPQKDGSYWIVPWETVVAQAIAMDSVGRHGKTTQGMLVVGFKNPDPNAKEGERDCSMGFSCGGGTTAMCLWECIRSYMEIGPEAAPKCHFEGEKTGRSLLGWFLNIMGDAIRSLLRGNVKSTLKDVFFTFFLGAPLGFYLQERKLIPPPDLTDPAIVEWSKPLPSEQWAKRSPEWDEAIHQREAELAREIAT
ncbi:hypothetical protein J2T41_006227 [Pseudomonas citronellolis]|uniref:hypothetical protein n=1 Tax=Pseudomonas citronellolis TaxID=53408 RepID=UPI00209E401D|nr:hypothetical protein [Pseudomonas citronellolis]MCP1669502.1 hypothetical protein [Pseudomonas citronellolis]MCP1701174.1 hypothetical protein [Pseudomonas citronellolis]MCP1707406.1 hypothetical protein [Pseudomonas citronellolis]MCP1801277.1 hypothetical protein [Pseudomonas citronellolis]